MGVPVGCTGCDYLGTLLHAPIDDSHVQIGTAAAAFMAIRILLDHGVREDRIIFITFLVARGGGVSVLRRAFPQVTIVCGAVDDEMREGWLEGYKGDGNSESTGRPVWVMQPGMGQIGQLYLVMIICLYISGR